MQNRPVTPAIQPVLERKSQREPAKDATPRTTNTAAASTHMDLRQRARPATNPRRGKRLRFSTTTRPNSNCKRADATMKFLVVHVTAAVARQTLRNLILLNKIAWAAMPIKMRTTARLLIKTVKNATRAAVSPSLRRRFANSSTAKVHVFHWCSVTKM